MEDRPVSCCIFCISIEKLVLCVAILEIVCDLLSIILAIAAYFTCFMTSCKNLLGETLRNWLSSLLKSPDEVLSAYIFCLVYSMCQLYTGFLLYSATLTKNASKCKLVFRASILLWFVGIIFWLYIVRTSHALIFITVSVYSVRYVNIAIIRRFLKELTVKSASSTTDADEPQVDAEVEEETRL